MAAGPVGRSAQASTDEQLRAEIYSYSRSRGLFAGVALPILLPVLAASVSGMRSQWAGGPIVQDARLLAAYAIALFGVSLLLYDHLWED